MTEALIVARDLTGAPVNIPGVTLTVDSYSWAALGGPARATLRATGRPAALGQLLNTLRCGVMIYRAKGEAVWWGYVQSVTLRTGAVEYGASLAGMFNSVRVAYSYVASGSSTLGERRTYPAVTTTPAQEAASLALYGQRDALISIGGASDATAAAACIRLLATFAAPQSSIDFVGDGADGATITCAGWWDTLDWRYYRQTGTADTATTAQIVDIVSASGALLAGVYIDTASGLTSSQYRDGDTTAGSEVEKLCAQGTSGGLPLWPRIWSDRYLHVEAEPARGAADYALLRSGLLLDQYGGAVPADRPVVGRWAALGDMLPVLADLAGVADISTRFITGWEWRTGAGRPALTWRGQPKPFDIATAVNR